MSQLSRRTPRSVAQGLRVATRATGTRKPAPTCLVVGAFARHMSSENQPEKPQPGATFRGQMTTSIMARLEREKAERERIFRERVESSGTRNVAILFSKEAPPLFSLATLLSMLSIYLILGMQHR